MFCLVFPFFKDNDRDQVIRYHLRKWWLWKYYNSPQFLERANVVFFVNFSCAKFHWNRKEEQERSSPRGNIPRASQDFLRCLNKYIGKVTLKTLTSHCPNSKSCNMLNSNSSIWQARVESINQNKTTWHSMQSRKKNAIVFTTWS